MRSSKTHAMTGGRIRSLASSPTLADTVNKVHESSLSLRLAGLGGCRRSRARWASGVYRARADADRRRRDPCVDSLRQQGILIPETATAIVAEVPTSATLDCWTSASGEPGPLANFGTGRP
jgi:hypothetical protein